MRAGDVDGDPVTFSSGNLPYGAYLHPTTGRFTWTPDYTQKGAYRIEIAASDGTVSTSVVWVVNVQNANGPVAFENVDKWEIYEGQYLSVNVTAVDPDNPSGVYSALPDGSSTMDEDPPPFTWTVPALPEGAEFNQGAQVFSWTPSFSQAGTYELSFTVTDDGDGLGVPSSATVVLTVVVRDVNAKPVVEEIPDYSVDVGDGPLVFDVSTTDTDGTVPELTVSSLPALPSSVTFVDNGDGTGTFTVTAADTLDRGVYTITVSATDDGNGNPKAVRTGTAPFVLSIVAPDAKPVMETQGARVAVTGKTFTFDVWVSDADEDPLTFSATGLPSGAVFTGTDVYGKAVFSWAEPVVGTYSDITLTVTDSGNGDSAAALSHSRTFTLTVRTQNAAPLLLPVGAKQVAETQTLAFTLGSIDADGDAVTYRVTGLPRGASFDRMTGAFTWTPGYDQAGIYSLRVEASDGASRSGEDVKITVTNTNRAPIFVPVNDMLTLEAFALEFYVQAGDLDGDKLTYSVVSAMPGGASFDPAIQSFSWTPGYNQAGVYTVTFKAQDPGGLWDTFDARIEVIDVNQAPSILRMSGHVLLVDEPFVLTVPGSDPDQGTMLTYTAEFLPAGASFDESTGVLSWTPLATQTGEHDIRLTVTDGDLSYSRNLHLVVSHVPIPPSVIVQFTPSFTGTVGQKVLIHAAAQGVADIAGLKVFVDGAEIALDKYGRATFISTRSGHFTVTASATDVDGQVGTAVRDLKVRDAADTAAPSVALRTPRPGRIVSSSMDVVGLVSDTNLDEWTLSLIPMGFGTPVTLAGGTSPASEGVLSGLDPTRYVNGAYELVLTARDMSGRESRVSRVIEISTSSKPDAFETLETDYVVVLGGIEIEIARRYTTLLRDASGSFGNGWILNGFEAMIGTNVPSSGEEDVGVFTPFGDGTRLYVELPSGERVGFTFTPVAHAATGVIFYTPAWTADAGVDWQLTTGSAVLEKALGRYYERGTGMPFNVADGDTFGETALRLISPDGTTYGYGTDGSLREIESSEGRVVVSDAGIFSADGGRIEFRRDASGRITSITTVDGTQILYEYDASGNLLAVDNLAAGTRSFYGYDIPCTHLLTEIVSPAGATAQAYGAGGALLWSAAVDRDLGTSRDYLNNDLTGQTASEGSTVRYVFVMTGPEFDTSAYGLITLAIEVKNAAGFNPDELSVLGVSASNVIVNEEGLFALFTLTEGRPYVLGITGEGSGTFDLAVSLVGDVNGDYAVDGTDRAAVMVALGTTSGDGGYDAAADVNRDGTVNNVDLSYVESSMGFTANQTPGTEAGSFDTYTNIPITIDLTTLSSDPEGRALGYFITNVVHGRVRMAGDGGTVLFTPEAGYTGVAGFDFASDDGIATSAVSTVTVTVSDAVLTGLTLEQGTVTTAVGRSVQIRVTGRFDDGGSVPLPGSLLTFSSRDTSIALVAGSGIVWARQEGSVVVDITRGTLSAAALVNVGDVSIPDVWDIFPDAYAMAQGDTRQVIVTVREDGTAVNRSAAAAGAVYVSGDSSVLAVTEDGLVSTTGLGSTTVTVICGAFRQELVFNVVTPVDSGGFVGSTGGVVTSGDGARILLAPGAIVGNVTITPLPSQALALGLPQGFTFAGGVDVSLGDAGTVASAFGLSIPVAGYSEGDLLYVFRFSRLLTAPDTYRDVWELVDTAVVDGAGVARTTSPPYSGITGDGDIVMAEAASGMGMLTLTAKDMEDGFGSTRPLVQVDSTAGAGYAAVWNPMYEMKIPVVAGDSRGVKILEGIYGELEQSLYIPLPGDVTLFESEVELSGPPAPQDAAEIDTDNIVIALEPWTATTGGTDSSSAEAVPLVDFATLNATATVITLPGKNFDPSNKSNNKVFFFLDYGFTNADTEKLLEGGDLRKYVVEGEIVTVTSTAIKVKVPAGAVLGRGYVRVDRWVTSTPMTGGPVQEWRKGEAVRIIDPAKPPMSVYYTWVVNARDGTVTAIDTMAQGGPKKVVDIKVGDYPVDVALSADGMLAFVSNLGEGTISVIDTVGLHEVDLDPHNVTDWAGVNRHRIYLASYAKPYFITTNGEQNSYTGYASDRDNNAIWAFSTLPSTYIGGGDLYGGTRLIVMPTPSALEGKKWTGMTGITVTMDRYGTPRYLVVASPGENSWSGGDLVYKPGFLFYADVRGVVGRPDPEKLTWAVMEMGRKPFGLTATSDPDIVSVACRAQDNLGVAFVKLPTLKVTANVAMTFSYAHQWEIQIKTGQRVFYETKITGAEDLFNNEIESFNEDRAIAFKNYFDLNNAESVVFTDDGKWAFVVTNNTFNGSDDFTRAPWLGRGGAIGIIWFRVAYDYTSGVLVGGTKEYPSSWPDEIAIDANNRYLLATFKGLNQVHVYDIEALKAAVGKDPATVAEQSKTQFLQPLAVEPTIIRTGSLPTGIASGPKAPTDIVAGGGNYVSGDGALGELHIGYILTGDKMYSGFGISLYRAIDADATETEFITSWSVGKDELNLGTNEIVRKITLEISPYAYILVFDPNDNVNEGNENNNVVKFRIYAGEVYAKYDAYENDNVFGRYIYGVELNNEFRVQLRANQIGLVEKVYVKVGDSTDDYHTEFYAEKVFTGLYSFELDMGDLPDDAEIRIEFIDYSGRKDTNYYIIESIEPAAWFDPKNDTLKATSTIEFDYEDESYEIVRCDYLYNAISNLPTMIFAALSGIGQGLQVGSWTGFSYDLEGKVEDVDSGPMIRIKMFTLDLPLFIPMGWLGSVLNGTEINAGALGDTKDLFSLLKSFSGLGLSSGTLARIWGVDRILGSKDVTETKTPSGEIAKDKTESIAEKKISVAWNEFTLDPDTLELTSGSWEIKATAEKAYVWSGGIPLGRWDPWATVEFIYEVGLKLALNIGMAAEVKNGALYAGGFVSAGATLTGAAGLEGKLLYGVAGVRGLGFMEATFEIKLSNLSLYSTPDLSLSYPFKFGGKLEGYVLFGLGKKTWEGTFLEASNLFDPDTFKKGNVFSEPEPVDKVKVGGVNGRKTVTGQNSVDYVNFFTLENSGAGNLLTIEYSASDPDVQVVLYDAEFNELRVASKVDATHYSLSMEGLPAGEYNLMLESFEAEHIDYTLDIWAPETTKAALIADLVVDQATVVTGNVVTGTLHVENAGAGGDSRSVRALHLEP